MHKISSKRSNINKNIFLDKYENKTNAKEYERTTSLPHMSDGEAKRESSKNPSSSWLFIQQIFIIKTFEQVLSKNKHETNRTVLNIIFWFPFKNLYPSSLSPVRHRLIIRNLISISLFHLCLLEISREERTTTAIMNASISFLT